MKNGWRCEGNVVAQGTAKHGKDATRRRSPVDGRRPDALFVNSVEKAFRVLAAFGAGRPTMGLSEIAAASGLNVSAAQRFTHTLLTLGYLARDAHSRRYRPAAKLLDFSFLYLRADAVVEIAIPFLTELGERSKETVNLSVLDGTDIVCVSRMPRHRVRSAAGVVGARRPTFCTSGGRAMLAHLPAETAVRILDESDWAPVTPATVTDRRVVLDRIADARLRGYCVVVEEFVVGEISVAAPILDFSGRAIAAVNIPVPTARWTVEAVHDRLAPLVVDTARSISRAKGATAGFAES